MHKSKIPGMRRWRRAMLRLRRAQITKKLTQTYLADHRPSKLQIGCGRNLVPGWLNTDYFPETPDIPHLDATKPFPLAGETFDYVFSEHMIEHITYAAGVFMLSECFRVLKPGGRIRISTPSLAFLIDLYSENKSALQQRYIAWASESFIRNGVCSDAMVINNFMRDWGHLFIYDEKTLRAALEGVGFVAVRARKLNESDDLALRDLESEERMPPGFLQLESLTLEATKPVPDGAGTDSTFGIR